MTHMKARPARSSRVAMIAGLTLLVSLGACDSLLDVPDPDVVPADVFADPENLPAVRAGALSEFARALAGEENDEGGQVLMSGLLTDELYHSGSFTTRQEIDARNIRDTNASNEEAFFELQRARNHAEQGAELFAASDEAGSESHAEVLMLAGYTYVYFAENYCSGVPFSHIPLEGGESAFGPPTTTAAMLDLALSRFAEAEGFGPSAALLSTIRVGRGRALLDQAQYAAAAQAVSAVPTSFVAIAAYSEENRRAYNAIWNLVNAERRWSASVGEGTNGIPFIVDGDPRAEGVFDGTGFDPSVDHYSQLKYPSPGADVPFATGVEARLIEAEAALQSGARGTFFGIHNALRATVGLADLVDTGQTQAQLVSLHFAERAHWLWLTSHRLGDLRRLVRQYGRPADNVFPIGPTELGSPRGSHVTLRVPFSESNNPNYSPSACDPTIA